MYTFGLFINSLAVRQKISYNVTNHVTKSKYEVTKVKKRRSGQTKEGGKDAGDGRERQLPFSAILLRIALAPGKPQFLALLPDG